MLRVIESATLAGHHEQWDDLVSSAPLPTPFLRSWWLSAVAGPAPVYLLVFDGPRLIGGLPLQRDRARPVEIYRFIGSPFGPLHMDLVAARGRALEVRIALRSWARARGDRIFDLDGVRDQAWVARLLLDGYATPRPPVGCAEARVLHEARITGAQQPAAGDPRREHWRADAESVPAAMAAFAALARGEGEALAPAVYRAVAAGVAAGEARVDVAEGADGPAAVLVTFVVAGRATTYRLAARPNPQSRASAAALLRQLVATAATDGCTAVDLGPQILARSQLPAAPLRAVWRVRAAHGSGAQLALALARDGRRVSEQLCVAAERIRTRPRRDGATTERRDPGV
jgi:hypothetical protein